MDSKENAIRRVVYRWAFCYSLWMMCCEGIAQSCCTWLWKQLQLVGYLADYTAYIIITRLLHRYTTIPMLGRKWRPRSLYSSDTDACTHACTIYPQASKIPSGGIRSPPERTDKVKDDILLDYSSPTDGCVLGGVVSSCHDSVLFILYCTISLGGEATGGTCLCLHHGTMKQLLLYAPPPPTDWPAGEGDDPKVFEN